MNINFCNPGESDIDSLRELWIMSFDEDPKACDIFFEKVYKKENTYIAKYNDKIISALYLLDTDFNGQKAHYLCGAATHSDYRKQGVMGNLICFALKSAKEKGDKYSFLFPANNNLYSYYKKFGYQEKCSAYISNFSRDVLVSFPALKYTNNNILKWNNEYKNFAAEYYSTYNIKSVKSMDYFALFEETDNTAEIFYFDCKDNFFKNMTDAILKSTEAEHFVFTHNGIFNNAQKIRYGMVKPLKDGITVPKDIYIGLTLN